MTDLVPLDEFEERTATARARASADVAAALDQPEPLTVKLSLPGRVHHNDRIPVELCRLCQWGTSSGRCDHPGDVRCPHT